MYRAGTYSTLVITLYLKMAASHILEMLLIVTKGRPVVEQNSILRYYFYLKTVLSCMIYIFDNAGSSDDLHVATTRVSISSKQVVLFMLNNFNFFLTYPILIFIWKIWSKRKYHRY